MMMIDSHCHLHDRAYADLGETLRVGAGRIFGYGWLDRRRQVGKLVPGLATMIAPR